MPNTMSVIEIPRNKILHWLSQATICTRARHPRGYVFESPASQLVSTCYPYALFRAAIDFAVPRNSIVTVTRVLLKHAL